MENKYCSKCDSLKSVDCFSRDKQKKDGLRPTCKECDNKKRRKINNPRRTDGEKICSKCKNSKHVSDFLRYKQSPDGLKHMCKACSREIDMQKNNVSIKDGDKVCSRCKCKKQAKEFGRDRRRKDGLCVYCKKCSSKIIAKASKRYKNTESYKKKNKVRDKTEYAIRKGIIVKKDYCETCGSKNDIQTHHKGYENHDSHLDVVFLCRKCHVEEHIRIEREGLNLCD